MFGSGIVQQELDQLAPGTVTDVTILFSKAYLLQLATLARLSPPYILYFFTYIDVIEVYVPSIESRMFILTGSTNPR